MLSTFQALLMPVEELLLLLPTGSIKPPFMAAPTMIPSTFRVPLMPAVILQLP
ncbi:MAG: hypothetical protein ACKO24_14105 [Leptolyngbyaceae cyanobacterium]